MGTLTGPAALYLLERRNRREITRGSAMRISYTLMSLDLSYGNRPVAKFGERAVERWLEQHPEWKPGTRATYMGQVRSFCRWLQRRKYITSDPFAELKSPRRPRPAPQPIPDDAIGVLLRHVPDSRGKLIIHLQWGLGLRCCGVANLKVEDIDVAGRTIVVTEKGGHSRRLPLMPEVHAALDRYLWEYPTISGPLVRSYKEPWAGIGAGYVSILVRRWMTECGVKRRAHDGRSAHALRRTVLTKVAEATGDAFVVAELAGWSSIDHAAHYVRRSSVERVRNALEQGGAL